MARRPEAQSIIVIIKAVRAFARAADVDTEALITELRDAKRLDTVTHGEVLALLEERYPEVEVLEPAEPEEEAAAFEQVLAGVTGAMPSGRRLIVALVASFLTGVCISYVTSMLLAYIIAGAMLLGAGSFLLLIITVLGWLASLIASYFAGKKVGAYILTGTVDEHIDSVKAGLSNAWDWITSPFSSDVKA